MEKGIVLTLDALFAILIVLTALSGISLLMSHSSYSHRLSYKSPHYLAEDAMEILSKKGYIDQIGALWAANETSEAENIVKNILNSLLPNTTGYELLINDEVVYSTDLTTNRIKKANSSFLIKATRIASGYEKGKPTYGYIAKAFLNKLSKIKREFAYFGGYVGEGNISRNLNLPNLDTVLQVIIEADAGGPFEFYINGNYAGNYTPSAANMSADQWIVCNLTYNPSYCNQFVPGINEISFSFTGEHKFIGGGFVEVDYNTTEPVPTKTVENATGVYWFPGIRGAINLYSSFYIPGTLSQMSIYLHYLNNMENSTIFFTIGNATVFESNQTGEQVITLNDTDIRSKVNSAGLSYSFLSNNTIPIRFGLKAYVTIMRGNADVILITDVSGSMDWRLDSAITGVERDCDDPDLYDPTTKRISLAKCLDKEFVDIVLNATGNRVGLVSFRTGIDQFHDLSNDTSSLKAQIDSYYADGGTCICCAENLAYEILSEQSDDSRQKFVVMMSDGIPTHACDGCTRPGIFGGCLGVGAQQCYVEGELTSPECWPLGCYGGEEDCTGNDCIRPMENANYSSCRLRNLGAVVDSIGFGPVSTCTNANKTLRWIAECGGGNYSYSTNATELKEIYSKIAKKIVEVSYQAQTIEGNISMDNWLSPKSYIKFNYTPIFNPLEYGKIDLTLKGPRFGGIVTSPKNGSFYVPSGTEVIDAKVTSYSSQYWTDRLKIINSIADQYVYKLWDYGENYQILGDPYIVQIPADKVAPGEENKVSIDTALTPINTTGGSPDNRAIFTVRFDGFVGYGSVFEKSEGSTVTIWYDSDQDGIADGSIEITIGNATDPYDPTKDAIDDAFERLMDKLNFINDTGENDGNQTNPIDIKISDLSIDSSPMSGIPSSWGPARITLLVWQ